MNTLEKIKDKERELDPLRKRFDRQAALARLDPYHLTVFDEKGKEHKMPGAMSITMNNPAVTLNAVISWLMAAKWQTVIKGKISPTLQTMIEEFQDDMYAEADERRLKIGRPINNHFFASHICSRGWICSRNLWLKDGDNYYPDLRPTDVRFFTWEWNDKGMEWGSNQMFRSASEINRQYNLNLTGTTKFEVYDHWDSKVNEVWINDKKEKEVENTIGYPPFVLTPAPRGIVFLDKDYLIDTGQGLLFMNEKMYEYLNQAMSINQTAGLKSVIGAYQKQSPAEAEKTPYPIPGAMDEYTEFQGPTELIQQPDLNRAGITYQQQILEQEKKGGLSDADLGMRQPNPASSLVITEQAEIRHQIQKPGLDGLASHYQMVSRQMIDQFVKFEISSKVGKKGLAKEYSAKSFPDPESYDISYVLTSRSRKLEIANIAISASARGELSRDTRIRTLMQLDDPEGEIARLEAEEARRLDPLLDIVEKGARLIYYAKDTNDPAEASLRYVEARLLRDRAIALIKQRRNPQAVQEEPKSEQPKVNTAMSALGGMIG